jgi:transposase
MPAPLSNDMRIRIIKARERGDTIAQIAREKEVNPSTIVRLLRLYRETGSYEARPLNNGRKPRLSPETLEIIRERIVIMDNLSSHKVKGIVEAIEAAGASVKYLPPYSPDLNPIELLWSKVKAILRKLKIRTKDLMDHAISQALDAISLDDIAAWFGHDGYTLC